MTKIHAQTKKPLLWAAVIALIVIAASVAAMILIDKSDIQTAEAWAPSSSETYHADASDRIDLYLDTAFEDYLAGNTGSAYENVSNAYFRVYETTGFERQTMSRISGNRKNAVEAQFSVCKGVVKNTGNETDEDRKYVRAALAELKAMIREDGNKLATMYGGVQSQTKFYKGGELVDSDPYPQYSGTPQYKNWYDAATHVKKPLANIYVHYKNGEYDIARDRLYEAYDTVYAQSGLAHAIYTDLSVEDRLKLEDDFTDLKQMLDGADGKAKKTAVKKAADKAINDVQKYGKAIDEINGVEESVPEEAASQDPRLLTFLGAFGIIVREGLEAILVIAAIIAYLVKSGNSRSLKNVYTGAIAGIAASFVAAAVLAWAKKAFVGAGIAQEVIEGITALIAVCVLFYVSNWMISKAEAASWSRYINGKVQSSVEQGSAFTLAFTAFLSVFREGAEVVLFYQPMLSEGNPGMVWAGFAVGCVLLVFIYLAITKLSIRLPIKGFFTATSILMAVMCVSFLGSGIKELAEGSVFDLRLAVKGIPENDVVQIFGIYPWLETLGPQLILSVVLLITFMIAHYRGKMDALKAEQSVKGAQ